MQSSLSGGRDDATVLVAKPLFFAERYQPPNPFDGDRQLRAQRRRRRAVAIAGALLAIALAAIGTWQLATSMNGGGAAAAVSSSSH